MKYIYSTILLFIFLLDVNKNSFAQEDKSGNLIIFLMDGYRWRELFQGADSSLLFSKQFNHKDSAWMVEKYWDADFKERRKKLMPFVWETIAQNGQIFGNRWLGNQVNVKNSFWFSYPGRSECFTGFFDTAINTNSYPNNPNTNVLEFINQQPPYRNKIAVFSSWDAVARIMNRERSGLYVNIFGEDVKGSSLTELQQETNLWQHLVPNVFGKEERVDAATYAMAKAYLLANHPKILYIDLGETDEFGHGGEYGWYLDAAHYDDAMFKDIWTTIQNDLFYKNKTTLLIFPDHGRGIGPDWTSHGAKHPHSDETYLIAMGPGITSKGEIKTQVQIYEEQYAQTIAALLGLNFTAAHPVAPPVKQLVEK
jgi:hypothetical protein